MEDSIELAKTAAEKASGALTTLYESVFPDKAVSKDLDSLAGSFDSEGGFLADFARNNTVCGLETTLLVLLGHGVSIDFGTVTSSVPDYTTAHSEQAVDATCKLQEMLEKHAQEQGDSSP